MQHTEKYKFNIIDTSDPFSPEPLNDNARKLEDALITHEAAVDSALKSQRLELNAADEDLSAQVVRAREENAFIKLAGLINNGYTNSVTLDLSKIDLSPYAAMLLYFNGRDNDTITTNLGSLGALNTRQHICSATIWFFRTGSGIVCQGLVSYGSVSSDNFIYSRSVGYSWDDLKTITIGGSDVYTVVLYGLKA